MSTPSSPVEPARLARVVTVPGAVLMGLGSILGTGVFGSRQEEAQRFGRILRPKCDGLSAYFFTLVSRDTREEEYAHHR